MTLSILGLHVTLSITMPCHYAECHCAECHYAECHVLFIVLLNVVVLSVVMLSVVAPSFTLIFVKKQLIWTCQYKEINRTDLPFP
jgi:hypothetical protein